MTRTRRCTVAFAFGLLCLLCGCQGSSDGSAEHSHDVPEHLPKSLDDLSKQLRRRVVMFQSSPTVDAAATADLQSELADLIAWAPEFAADTQIDEKTWIPIFELSETLRSAAREDAWHLDSGNQDQTLKLCSLLDEAWETLEPKFQVDRYQEHSHSQDHGHGHDHHDGHGHSHDGHSHSHDGHSHGHSHDGDSDGHSHDDDGHSHSHGDHDHGHSHDQHSHEDHDHSEDDAS